MPGYDKTNGNSSTNARYKKCVRAYEYCSEDATKNEDELYDLQIDPKELNNIAAQHKDIVKKEYEMLGAWVQYHDKIMNGLIKGSKN